MFICITWFKLAPCFGAKVKFTPRYHFNQIDTIKTVVSYNTLFTAMHTCQFTSVSTFLGSRVNVFNLWPKVVGAYSNIIVVTVCWYGQCKWLLEQYNNLYFNDLARGCECTIGCLARDITTKKSDCK